MCRPRLPWRPPTGPPSRRSRRQPCGASWLPLNRWGVASCALRTCNMHDPCTLCRPITHAGAWVQACMRVTRSTRAVCNHAQRLAILRGSLVAHPCIRGSGCRGGGGNWDCGLLPESRCHHHCLMELSAFSRCGMGPRVDDCRLGPRLHNPCMGDSMQPSGMSFSCWLFGPCLSFALLPVVEPRAFML